MVNFSVVVIAKNEALTLPRLVKSLSDFQKRGGCIVVLDTGSTDGTADVARRLGCKVEEVGNRFNFKIDHVVANKINKKFVEKGDQDIVSPGDTFFNFSAARNYAASLSPTDIVSMPDCDEIFTALDIDYVEGLIKNGHTQFEFNFVFSHDQYGNELIKFVQSKMYDRRSVKWNGIIHEVLSGSSDIVRMPEDKFKIEHYQNEKTNRSGYLKGLAVDCYNSPNNDRNSHYFGRELMFCGRYKSAIKELKRHIAMDKWVQEKAQSMIYIGDCYKMLKNHTETETVNWYNKAFQTDSTRREPLMALAQFYHERGDHQRSCCYAAAALEIPRGDFYGNFEHFYANYPWELLYVHRWWIGNKEGSKEAYDKAVSYQPNNPMYIQDRQFYYSGSDQKLPYTPKEVDLSNYEYKGNDIEGWMSTHELKWLYDTAKTMNTAVEIGSWKGRSSHAIASGIKKAVICVDTWQGSSDVGDATNSLAKKEDVYGVFLNNMRVSLHTNKARIIRANSVNASTQVKDKGVDMVFIDAGHTKEEVREDITAWLPKCKKIICGHDYCSAWPGVIEAVDEIFGKPDGVEDSIWWVDLEKRVSNSGAVVIKDNSKPVIPKKIFTIWLGGEMPFQISKCIESQKIPGYKHTLITLDNCPKNITYVNQAIEAKNWVKASDYLRLHYLRRNGGIYLDADVEILPGKNFDHLLHMEFFAAREENGFISNAVIGSAKQLPLLKSITDAMTSSFSGNDDLVFQSGMELFTKNIDSRNIPVLEPEYFIPYNHQNGSIKVTDKTICFHHFCKSWLSSEDILPSVTILIPTLGRPEGLKRCLESIDKLYYPKHLIQTIVLRGNETVPKKIEKGLKMAKGKVIVYASNDIAFMPESIYIAAWNLLENDLVAFNTGEVLPDEGNICEHFAIRKDFIPKIGGSIFDTRFHHVGCDNLLWAKAKKYGKAVRLDHAVVEHFHFSTKKSSFDNVYNKGWEKFDQDRKLLAKLLKEL